MLVLQDGFGMCIYVVEAGVCVCMCACVCVFMFVFVLKSIN